MIELKNITKIYPNGVVANNNISFNIPKNKVIGIVGKNGSGKTTLIRQILGLLKPTSGEIVNEGINNIAYVPQLPVFFPALTVRETIEINLRYFIKEREERSRRTDEIIRRCKMEEYQNKYSYQLSGGMKKILLIGQALSLNKEYIILDEPTSMVDLLNKRIIWDIIKDSKKDKGILLASHDILEVKELCDTIIVIDKGEISFVDNVKNINAGLTFVKINADNDIKELYFGNLEEALHYIKQVIDHNNNMEVELEYPAIMKGVIEHVSRV